MEIGPLEYVVIGFEDNQFTRELLPELNTIQQKGAIRVVDLLFAIICNGIVRRKGQEHPPVLSW